MKFKEKRQILIKEDNIPNKKLKYREEKRRCNDLKTDDRYEILRFCSSRTCCVAH